MKTIRVLVCRVGRLPAVTIFEADRSGGFIDRIQETVGGLADYQTVDGDIDCWFNDDSEYLGLPVNRAFQLAPNPQMAESLERAGASLLITDPGRSRAQVIEEVRTGVAFDVRGDFVLARVDREGGTIGLTDEDVARYIARFDTEDVAAAQQMNDRRARLGR